MKDEVVDQIGPSPPLLTVRSAGVGGWDRFDGLLESMRGRLLVLEHVTSAGCRCGFERERMRRLVEEGLLDLELELGELVGLAPGLLRRIEN